MNDTVVPDDSPTEVYELPTQEAAAITEGLMRIWEKLGKPENLSTNAGWIVLDQIIGIWEKFYPQEVADWKHDRDLELAAEKDLTSLAKGGYNASTYPPILFQLMKGMFPEVKFQDKALVREITQRYPLFKSTNLNI